MEKTLTLDDDNQFITTSPPQSQPFYANNALFRYVADVYTSFADRRAALGLSNPGNIEGISREVHRDVLLSTSAFTGLRADISYTHSANPLFQTSHSLASGMQELPPYNYATMYGTASVCYSPSINFSRRRG